MGSYKPYKLETKQIVIMNVNSNNNNNKNNTNNNNKICSKIKHFCDTTTLL